MAVSTSHLEVLNFRCQLLLQPCRLSRSFRSDSQSCRLSMTLEHFESICSHKLKTAEDRGFCPDGLLMELENDKKLLLLLLFALSQLWTFCKSSFKLVWIILWILLLAYVRWVSSAYIRGSQFESQLGRSLIYNRNNNGPKIVAWGTPLLQVRAIAREETIGGTHLCSVL